MAIAAHWTDSRRGARNITVEDQPPALGTEQPAPRTPGRLSLAILLVTVASVVAVVADWRSPVRSVLALGFLLFAPGLAVTEMLAIREPFQRLALAPATSLALETIVALPLLYAGAFSLNLVLFLLAGLIVAALVLAAIRARRPAAESRVRRYNA
jgi:uncharacterized membrane protein